MENKLPADIEFLVNEDGVFIEVESFIRFLRNNKDVPEDYQGEVRHLNKIADYISEQLAELIAQRKLLNEVFKAEMPN